MFAMVFFPIIAIAFNAHICAVDATDTNSVLEAMKPGACVGRLEVFNVNQ